MNKRPTTGPVIRPLEEDPFDSIPDECKVPEQRSEIGRRRASGPARIGGGYGYRYAPARRATRSRYRVLYAPSTIAVSVCVLGVLGVGFGLIGASLSWW